MTPEQALAALNKIIEAQTKGWSDIEADHGEADNILCEVLLHLNLLPLVQAFRKVEKWYA
jgi:hypothetical protein